MLRELQIENVAVIEKAVVSFREHFNVLTGETGAGKSILIDSINAILGNRTNKEIVRSGADKATIFAFFDQVPEAILTSLREQGYDVDGELVLSREVFSEGRSACRINGRPATASTVRELCQNLVNIHGQLDNQELLDPERHVFVLDKYADLQEQLSDYQVSFTELLEIQKEINKLSFDEAEKAKRMDYLRYQINEIDKAGILAGEEEELQAQRNLMKNSEKITTALLEVISLTDESDTYSGSPVSSILYASNELEKLEGLSPEIDSLRKRVSDVYYELNDIVESVQQMLPGFDYDPNRLNEIEDRLDLLHRLERKYGGTCDDILKFREDAEKELSRIETSDELLEQLKAKFKEKKTVTLEKAQALSKRRLEAFSRFSGQLKEELTYLNMPSVELALSSFHTRELTPIGIDSIEFLISTNPGEKPKALSKIASGGEMARIMLAIKCVLADKDGIPTLIFDEVDTGVSGSGAQKIGVKLSQTAQSHQVICVTHSAQVASYADQHLLIEKAVRNGRTYTTVSELTGEQRIRELARIISGENITDIALKNAQEMLILSNKFGGN